MTADLFTKLEELMNYFSTCLTNPGYIVLRRVMVITTDGDHQKVASIG